MTAPESVVRAVERELVEWGVPESTPWNSPDPRAIDEERRDMARDLAAAAVTAYLASPDHAALLRAERAAAVRDVAAAMAAIEKAMRDEPVSQRNREWKEGAIDAMEEATRRINERADRIEGGDQ